MCKRKSLIVASMSYAPCFTNRRTLEQEAQSHKEWAMEDLKPALGRGCPEQAGGVGSPSALTCALIGRNYPSLRI